MYVAPRIVTVPAAAVIMRTSALTCIRSKAIALNEQATNHKTIRMQSEALLAGRIFDDRGNRMSPTHVRKGGIKYRYYLSSALLRGAAERAGSVRRVPAAEIDALVTRSVRDRLALSEPMDDRALVGRHVARVEVQREQLVVELAGAEGADAKRTLQIPGRRRSENGAAKFSCLRGCRHDTSVRSGRKRAPHWSQRLPGDVVGSPSLPRMRQQPRKPLRSVRAAASAR